MPSIAAIANDTVALQLGLCGIPVREAPDARAAEDILEPLLDGHDQAQVVVVQESLRQGFSDYMREKLARHRGAPLVVYCPPFDQEDSQVDAYLSAVLRPAVGFEIRLD